MAVYEVIHRQKSNEKLPQYNYNLRKYTIE